MSKLNSTIFLVSWLDSARDSISLNKDRLNAGQFEEQLEAQGK